jgi:hypothetical protein
MKTGDMWYGASCTGLFACNGTLIDASLLHAIAFRNVIVTPAPKLITCYAAISVELGCH